VRWCALVALALAVTLMAGCSTKAERLYNRAETFLAQDQAKLAADEYERLTDEFPRHPLADDALYKVAYIYSEEMNKPSLAMARYRRLADRYPRSSYVDDALLRIMDIQRTELGSPDAVGVTCDELCRRFPARKQLCAQGRLTVALTYFDTKQYEEAAASAQLLLDQYSAQERQCAQAALLIARAAEKQGDLDRDAVVALYEHVVTSYPDTHSAATAKGTIGWLYYEKRGEHEEQQRAQMKQQSRIIRGVPGHGGEGTQRQALSVLRSALIHRGAERSMQDLLALSGVAFEFVFDPARPGLAQAIFPRNPFETIASRLEFAYNVWSSGSAPQAFDSVHQALLQDHPVIILYGSASQWILVTGYDMEGGQVHYLPPGRDEYAVTAKRNFLDNWGAAGGGSSALAPGKFYQFSLAARLRTPPESEVVSETLRQAADLMMSSEITGAPAGAVAWDRLATELEACNAPEADGKRVAMVKWAATSLSASLRNSEAATAYLRHAAEVISTASGRLTQLADRHAELVTETQLLADKIAEAGGEEPPPAIWETAAAQASFISALHSRCAEQFAEVLTGLSQ